MGAGVVDPWCVAAAVVNAGVFLGLPLEWRDHPHPSVCTPSESAVGAPEHRRTHTTIVASRVGRNTQGGGRRGNFGPHGRFNFNKAVHSVLLRIHRRLFVRRVARARARPPSKFPPLSPQALPPMVFLVPQSYICLSAILLFIHSHS